MCNLCDKKSVYEFTNQRKLCKTCFIRWFEKKFLYTIRKFEMISKAEIVGFYDKKDFRNVVLKNLLEMYNQKGIITLIKMPSRKVNRVAVSDSADVISGKIVNKVVKGDLNKLKIKPVDGKIILPLFLFLDKEIELYAKLKKLKFSSKDKEENKLNLFIDELEKKHPEIKQAIVQSWLKIN